MAELSQGMRRRMPFSAPGSLGKEEAKAETFHRNPAGNQPRPAELASGRKRVLRGAGATRAAKRRQRVGGPCDRAPKYFLAGADVVKGTEGRVAAPQWPGVRDPAGVREQGTSTRVPQEPGRPRRLLGRSRPEVPGDQLQARGRGIRWPRERNSDATGIPAVRRQRSAAGRAAGIRSVE